eukprot:GHVS01058340.1.p1 GENE.GHVS01058340.1~~GHVS01058340.1.p1  ORF type:complete len:186 (-),score=26.28 GHVS01058340.1:1085-1642(-)
MEPSSPMQPPQTNGYAPSTVVRGAAMYPQQTPPSSYARMYGYPDVPCRRQFQRPPQLYQAVEDFALEVHMSPPFDSVEMCHGAQNATSSQHRSLKRLPSLDSLNVSSSSCRSSPRSELSSAPNSPVVRLDTQPSQTTNQPQEADGSSFIERMRETLFSPRSWMENPEHCHRLLSQMMKIQQQNEV